MIEDQADTNSIIVEEAIESSISNIEMSKSEKSLQKPLKMAVSNLPSSQERNPSMTELTTTANAIAPHGAAKNVSES